MDRDLEPDELDILHGPVLEVVCYVCNEPTEDLCPICGTSICNICQPEHENGDSCEVFLD